LKGEKADNEQRVSGGAKEHASLSLSCRRGKKTADQNNSQRVVPLFSLQAPTTAPHTFIHKQNTSAQQNIIKMPMACVFYKHGSRVERISPKHTSTFWLLA